MIDLPQSVRPLFVASGWFPERSVPIHFDRVANLASFPMAAILLRTFGGLKVGRCGRGRDLATSNIEFTERPSLDDRGAVAGMESPGTDLFPIGKAHHAHMELFLDSEGRLLAYGVPDGSLRVVGNSFGTGAERLLLGHAWHDQ